VPGPAADFRPMPLDGAAPPEGRAKSRLVQAGQNLSAADAADRCAVRAESLAGSRSRRRLVRVQGDRTRWPAMVTHVDLGGGLRRGTGSSRTAANGWSHLRRRKAEPSSASGCYALRSNMSAPSFSSLMWNPHFR
jgi:hypothetical protein